MESKKHINWYVLIIFTLVFITSLLHYTTPIKYQIFHEVYRMFYFVPIIIASFRFRLSGGILTSIVIALIYLPHVIFQWGGNLIENIFRFTGVVLYLVVGSLAGVLSNNVYKERERYKKAAKELELSYRKLQNQSDQLAEMETELIAADRLAVMGELTASLAHEVRNPLGSIKGAADILKKRNSEDNTAREFATLLNNEVNRLNQVVENYLMVAHRPVDHIEKSDLEKVVRSALDLVGPEIRRRQIQLHCDLPDHPLMVCMQEVEVRQVFLNLILNSLEALNDEGHLHIRTEVYNKKVEAVVSDTGKGIPADNIEKIFQPFFTTRKGGTGLGLSIVKRIMQSHKGNIKVESKENKGTSFTLIFRQAK